MIWTTPNILTMIRMFLIIIFLFVFYIPFSHHNTIGASIVLVAAITDWLDGFVARYFKQTSKLGAFLDPVADKIMVSTVLTCLIEIYPYPWMVLPSIIIICREILVSALREWIAKIGKSNLMKVSFIAKIKTCFQMIAIVILLIQNDINGNNNILMILSIILLYLSVIFTIYSMAIYLSNIYKVFKYNTNNDLK